MLNLQNLDPVNFAFVMATTIISITLNILGSQGLSEIFFWLSTVGFTLLVLLFAMHLSLFPKQMVADLANIEILFIPLAQHPLA